jgi:hypothetical protein
MEEGAFPELYYRRWPVETKYNRVKQKMELENFSSRLADNIKQDFYSMMTVSDMLASGLREANEKIPKGENGKKEVRIPGECEPRGGGIEGPAHRDTDNG